MTWLSLGLFLAGLALGFYLALVYCRRQILRLPDREIAEKLLRGNYEEDVLLLQAGF